MADQALQTAEARLYAAGFTRRLDFWVAPGEDRALGLDDAVALLDAGETSPPTWPGVHPDAVAGFQPLSEEHIDLMLRPPPPTEPPPLPGWAEPWAAMVAEQTAEKLRPIVKAEIRSALRAEARKREAAS